MNIKDITGKIRKIFSTDTEIKNQHYSPPLFIDFEAIDALTQSSINHTKQNVESGSLPVKKANEMLWFILSQTKRMKTKNCISVSQFQKMLDYFFELITKNEEHKVKIRFSHTYKQNPYFLSSSSASIFIAVIDCMIRNLKNSNLLFFVLFQNQGKFTLLAEKNNFEGSMTKKEMEFYDTMQLKYPCDSLSGIKMNHTIENNLLKIVVSESGSEQNNDELCDIEINSKLVKYDYGNI